jgi:mercuric ion transport protein
MQRFSITSIGAVVAATLASLCCVGPLVLAGLGIAGLGSAGLAVSIFEPYRPYLMGFTVLFLGVAFFMTYRKQEDSCEEGKACAVPASLKMRKVGLWSVTGLTALMLAVPYLPTPSTSSQDNSGLLATTTLELVGLT